MERGDGEPAAPTPQLRDHRHHRHTKPKRATPTNTHRNIFHHRVNSQPTGNTQRVANAPTPFQRQRSDCQDVHAGKQATALPRAE